MKIEPEHSSCSIVLLGTFNPAIFQPAWLNLTGVEDNIDDPTEIRIIHRDIANFTVGVRNYFVDKERFQIESASAPWVNLLDVVSKIFGENLIHTPIRAFGVNMTVHFRLPSHDAQMQLGRKLAPVEPWGRFGKEMLNSDKNLPGGLHKLTMRLPRVHDGIRIDTNATVEPSPLITGNLGVSTNVNHHHVPSDFKEEDGSDYIVSALKDRFQKCLDEADGIINDIMQVGLER